jgi:DNA-binding transcriptional ArsR family regulator
MSLPDEARVETSVDDAFVIDDLETLKVIADPLRKRIMELLEAPGTVKMVAQRLGMPPSKLYYHVNLLEDHGLLRVTDMRLVSGIVEKHYQVAARTINVKSGLLSPSVGDDGLNMMLSEMLEETANDIRAAAREGVIDFETDAPKQRKLFMSRLEVTLTDEQALVFQEQLKAMIESLSDAASDDEDPNVREYIVQVSMFPRYAPRPAANPPETD